MADPVRVQGPRAGFIIGADVATAFFQNQPTKGNLLIAHVYSNGGSSTSGDASISGWTLANQVQHAAVGAFLWLFYKYAEENESGTVTAVVANTGAGSINMAIEEWSQVGNLDQVASTPTTGSGVTSRSSGTTPTTTYPKEILFASFATGAAISSGSQTFSNGFTLDADFGSSNFYFLATKVVTVVGTYESTMSWTTSRNAGGMITTFQALQDVVPDGVSAAGSWTDETGAAPTSTKVSDASDTTYFKSPVNP